jgi:hypothetical protein
MGGGQINVVRNPQQPEKICTVLSQKASFSVFILKNPHTGNKDELRKEKNLHLSHWKSTRKLRLLENKLINGLQ